MNIGLSTTIIEPSQNKGHIDGIGVYTTQLLCGLRSCGHHVSAYSFPLKKLAINTYEFKYSQPFPGSFSFLSGLGIVSGGLIRQSLPVELMHFTDYRIFPVKCPAIATLHDAIPLKYPEMCNQNFRKIKNFVQISSAKFVDHVITLSHASVPDIVEYYHVPEQKISVIGCGVSDEWLADISETEVEAVLKLYSLQKGYFLFVGTIQPRKNLDRVIDAYKRLPLSLKNDRKLVCVGKPGWQCEKTIERLNSLVAEGSAIWLADISSDHELRCIYSGAGVFVFPSLYEGFGIPILEAFSRGVPVITSNTSSLPEVSRQIGVEIEPTSVDELTDAMEWLAQDATECSRRAAAGKKLANKMTWNAVVQNTLDVYRKFI